MKKANIFVNNTLAGELQELIPRKHYRVVYLEPYKGAAISLTMPITKKVYDFDHFPPFFEGLLPEGIMLEALLKKGKIDRGDLMSQIIKVGRDLVGYVTVEGVE